MCPVNMMRCQVEARAGKRRQGIADGEGLSRCVPLLSRGAAEPGRRAEPAARGTAEESAEEPDVERGARHHPG